MSQSSYTTSEELLLTRGSLHYRMILVRLDDSIHFLVTAVGRRSRLRRTNLLFPWFHKGHRLARRFFSQNLSIEEARSLVKELQHLHSISFSLPIQDIASWSVVAEPFGGKLLVTLHNNDAEWWLLPYTRKKRSTTEHLAQLFDGVTQAQVDAIPKDVQGFTSSTRSWKNPLFGGFLQHLLAMVVILLGFFLFLGLVMVVTSLVA